MSVCATRIPFTLVEATLGTTAVECSFEADYSCDFSPLEEVKIGRHCYTIMDNCHKEKGTNGEEIDYKHSAIFPNYYDVGLLANVFKDYVVEVPSDQFVIPRQPSMENRMWINEIRTAEDNAAFNHKGRNQKTLLRLRFSRNLFPGYYEKASLDPNDKLKIRKLCRRHAAPYRETHKRLCDGLKKSFALRTVYHKIDATCVVLSSNVQLEVANPQDSCRFLGRGAFPFHSFTRARIPTMGVILNQMYGMDGDFTTRVLSYLPMYTDRHNQISYEHKYCPFVNVFNRPSNSSEFLCAIGIELFKEIEVALQYNDNVIFINYGKSGTEEHLFVETKMSHHFRAPFLCVPPPPAHTYPAKDCESGQLRYIDYEGNVFCHLFRPITGSTQVIMIRGHPEFYITECAGFGMKPGRFSHHEEVLKVVEYVRPMALDALEDKDKTFDYVVLTGAFAFDRAYYGRSHPLLNFWLDSHDTENRNYPILIPNPRLHQKNVFSEDERDNQQCGGMFIHNPTKSRRSSFTQLHDYTELEGAIFPIYCNPEVQNDRHNVLRDRRPPVAGLICTKQIGSAF